MAPCACARALAQDGLTHTLSHYTLQLPRLVELGNDSFVCGVRGHGACRQGGDAEAQCRQARQPWPWQGGELGARGPASNLMFSVTLCAHPNRAWVWTISASSLALEAEQRGPLMLLRLLTAAGKHTRITAIVNCSLVILCSNCTK